MKTHALAAFFSTFFVAATGLARASVGLEVIEARAGFGPITLFYPSAAPSAEVEAGLFRSMRRSTACWKRRPAELSHAIDAVAADPRFAKLLDLGQVGVYGMSAGGHAALVLAGGRWSPARFAGHCAAHIAQDFPACVGLFVRLDGGWADSLKTGIARALLRWRFDDATSQQHEDPRVRAVVAAVPVAAVFDPASLRAPRVPVGLIEAGQDGWLAPRFHVEALRRVCTDCRLPADLKTAGQGALLSPFPPDLSEAQRRLLDDPPGFDRAALPAVHRSITQFFSEHLLP